ncbi:MAG: hypothetical protein ACREPR_09725 [Brasilonema sp.]
MTQRLLIRLSKQKNQNTVTSVSREFKIKNLLQDLRKETRFLSKLSVLQPNTNEETGLVADGA